MVFKDRTEAGKKLADELLEFKGQNLLILSLPRGGVPIGFEIAKKLNAPLDVLVVRKLGAPQNPEFGIGAIAPGGVRIIDEEAILHLGISRAEVNLLIREEREELDRRIREYRGSDLPLDIKGKIVILVDDGLATGVTARAAIKYILRQHPRKLIVAMPVCALDSVESIRSLVRSMVDEVICLNTPYELNAIGSWYKDFSQVSDLEVVDLLKKSKKPTKRSREPYAILHKIK